MKVKLYNMMKYVGLGLFFTILMCWMSCKNEQELVLEEMMSLELLEILSHTIEVENERFEYRSTEIMMDLRDPARYKYLPLKMGFDSIHSKNEAFNRLLQKLNIENLNPTLSYTEKTTILSQLDDFITKRDASILQLYEKILSKEYRTFNFRDKKTFNSVLKEKKQTYQNLALKYPSKATKKIVDNRIFKLHILKLQYDEIQKRKFLRDLFYHLMMGNTMYFDIQFPIVSPKKNCINLGEDFEAEIVIGNYAVYNPMTTKILINGETLTLNEETGKAHYKIKTTNKGEVELNIKYQILNELTGEISKGRSVYRYEVR